MEDNEKRGGLHLAKKTAVKICIYLAVILVVSLLLCNRGYFAAPDTLAYKQFDIDSPFGEITASNSLVQGIRFEQEQTVTDLRVMMATWDRENSCQVVFSVYRNDELLCSEMANAADLGDGVYYTVRDINGTVTPDDTLYLLIASPDGEPGNSVTVWMNSASEDGGLYAYDPMNDTAQKLDGTVVVSVMAASKNTASIPRIVVFICLFALVLAVLDSFVRWLIKPKRTTPKTALSKRDRHEALFYRVLFILTTVQMVWRFLYGFRWPSEYVQSSTVFTYENGFLPRSLIGSVLKATVLDLLYNKTFLSLFILSVGLMILVMLICAAYHFSVKTHNLIGSAVMLWFSLSIYDAFLAYEMGYFEQYGYVLILVVILFFDKIRNDRMFIVSITTVIFLSLLIGETNAFLICPVLVSICLLRIFSHAKEKRQAAKNVALLLILNIPTVAYCFFAGSYDAPQEQISSQIDLIKGSNLQFQSLEEIGGYYRASIRLSNDYTKVIPFGVNNWQLMVYMMLIVFTVALMLALGKRFKEMCLFIGTSGIVILGGYFTNTVGWDSNRWEFAQAMAITLLAIWELRHIYIRETVRTKDILYTLVIGTMIMLSIMDYRVWLFGDPGGYNSNLMQVYHAVTDFIRANIL